jgi:hypothetical protein
MIRFSPNPHKTARRRIRRRPEIEVLERRRVLNGTAKSLTSWAQVAVAAEQVNLRSDTRIDQRSQEEMIRKWQAQEDHIFAQLTMAGAVIAGAAAVPQTFATGEILRVAFWKSLSKMEAIEASLEAIDYAKNFHEFISDPLASNATIHDALQKIVEGNLDWFTSHPPFYKLALSILAKGDNQTPTPKPAPSPTPTPAPTPTPGPNSIVGTWSGTYSGGDTEVNFMPGFSAGTVTLTITSQQSGSTGQLTVTGIGGQELVTECVSYVDYNTGAIEVDQYSGSQFNFAGTYSGSTIIGDFYAEASIGTDVGGATVRLTKVGG